MIEQGAPHRFRVSQVAIPTYAFFDGDQSDLFVATHSIPLIDATDAPGHGADPVDIQRDVTWWGTDEKLEKTAKNPGCIDCEAKEGSSTTMEKNSLSKLI
ncbi:hypothetical protein SAMN06265221_1406 [Paracoccus laeviglucosivorans]|uniref:Uncharacterized protein n=2 Tax=Paracoccus laeviglucosivorans TaxID=1197861 RepID=A0A521FSE1_9RHOB|nr:hypothetical protein SAMN06265221_1406 [Paracoccus laeviglucosivorans]